MDAYVQKNHLEEKVNVIHNEKRLGAMTNWYNTLHNLIPDHKVVVNLDGDDLLAHDNVLLTLEKYYSDPDIWLTYGQGRTFPTPGDTAERIPDSVFLENKVRWHLFVPLI